MPPEMLQQQQAVQQAAQMQRQQIPAKMLPLDELRRWQRFTQKRNGEPNREFNPENIEPWIVKAVKIRLERDWQTAFDPFLKQANLRVRLEKRLEAAMNAIYEKWMPQIQEADTSVRTVDLTPMYAEIRAAAEPIYADAVSEQILTGAARLGAGVDYEQELIEASTWADRQADLLIQRVSNTDHKYIERITNQVREGKITAEGAADMIAKAWGTARARLIAVSEVGYGLQNGSDRLQDSLRVQGIKTVQRWLTQEDERVCPVCEGLDHTTEDVWREIAPDGRAHAGCRCDTVVEYA